MKLKTLVTILSIIFCFGLKAQKRSTNVLDCSSKELQIAQVITYSELEKGKEYFIKFPHHLGLEFETHSLFSSQHPTNIYWSENTLFFTPLSSNILFNYPGLNEDEFVINCSVFYLSASSTLKMDDGIQTENGFDIIDLISFNLLGDICVDVSNVDGPNNSNGYGVFTDGLSSIGIDEGIVLLTGNINSAEGPNSGATASGGGASDGTDPDLAQLISNTQHNVVKVEFDFVPDEDKISFDYVFASEEYCDYVNSSFNDVFGFFISGPGINGPFSGGAENIAVVPGTNDPVTINNINWETTDGLYNTNEVAQYGGGCTIGETQAPKPFSQLFGLDGFTAILTAEADVIPCETYHIKLVIADIGDGLFDSGIFLGQNSFISGEINASTNLSTGSIDGDNIAEEGCETAYIAFNVSPPNEEVTFNLNILNTSTATYGIDYEAFPPTYTVPQGTEFDTLWIDVFGDAILEGIETIDIEVTGLCGCEAPIVTIELEDPPFYEQNVVLCDGESLITSEGVFNSAGQYYTVVETEGECDSLYLLNLTYHPASVYDTTIYRCFTETAEYLGETFQFAPDYKEINLEGASLVGCDSLVRVNFEWVNPDLLIGGSDEFSCTNTEIDLFVLNNPIPANINYYQWVTPDLDTLSGDTISASSIGEYQLLSYIELEDRVCSNFFPNTLTLEADDELPMIIPLDDISVICDQNIPVVSPDLSNEDILNNLTYQWILPDNSTQNGMDITPTIEGTYTFIVTNLDNDCTSQETFEYTSTDILPEIQVIHDGIGCNALSVTLNSSVDVSGGTYSWTGPNGFTSNEENPQVNETGFYTLEYTLSPNCVNSFTTELMSNDSIPDLLVQGDTIICNQGTGQLSFFSDEIETFVWTGPNNFTSTDSLPIVTNEGTYTLQVSALNGCTNEAFADLTYIDIQPEISTIDTSLNCYNLSVNLPMETDSEDGIISWTGPNNFNSTELNPLATEEGTYTISITNQEGCTEVSSLDITIDTLSPIFNINGESIDCENIIADLFIETNNEIISYNWAGPNGFTSTFDSIQTQQSGVYSAVITSSNGCSTIQDYTVNVDTIKPSINAINDTLDCNTGLAQIEVNILDSNTEFSWFDPDDNPINDNTTTIEVEVEGTYTIVVLNTINNCETIEQIEVYPNTLSPDLSVSGDLITCEDTPFQVFSTSNFTDLQYNWTGPSGFSSSEANPIITDEGNYVLQIISQDDCITTEQLTVLSDLVKPEISVSNDTLNCVKTQTTLALNDNNNENTYQWSFNNAFLSNDKNPTISESGIYNVNVVGQNYCDTSAFVEISIDTIISPIQGDISNVIDCNNLTSQITLSTNYPPNTIFEWIGASFTSDEQSIEIEDSGQYNVIVTTTNGCTTEASFLVEEDFTIIEIEIEEKLINCYEPTTTLEPTISSNEYESITWSGPSSFVSENLEPSVSEEGIYSLTIIGFNGCFNTQDVEVFADFTEPSLEINDGQLSCNQEVAIIENTADNNYSYQWSSSSSQDVSTINSAQIEIFEEGNYNVTVTDLINGCINTDVSIVTALPDIQGFEIETDNPDCFNPFGNIEITEIEGGTGPFLYSIDGGETYQNGQVFSDLSAGEYNVLIQDAFECIDTASAIIVSLQDFELEGSGPFVLFVGSEQQITVETSLLPEEIVSINWTPDESLSCSDCLNPVSYTKENVIYTITVIDIYGCIYEANIEIRVLENPYYIPNVFTPNNDDKNDFFSIFGDLELIQNVNQFSIYDRWGEKVFHTENVLATDESMKWYGDFKNEPAKAGVYAYYIEYISISGELVKSTGDVTILR